MVLINKLNTSDVLHAFVILKILILGWISNNKFSKIDLETVHVQNVYLM